MKEHDIISNSVGLARAWTHLVNIRDGTLIKVKTKSNSIFNNGLFKIIAQKLQQYIEEHFFPQPKSCSNVYRS